MKPKYRNVFLADDPNKAVLSCASLRHACHPVKCLQASNRSIQRVFQGYFQKHYS
jgi:hypothetical protein